MERDETQQRINWLTSALGAVTAKPETLDRIRESLDNGDVKAFGELVLDNWREFEVSPPPDKCDPWVTVYVTVLKPPTYVEVCTWIGPTLAPGDTLQLAGVGGTAGELKSALVSRRFLDCKWVPVNQDDVIVAKKFAQGICPPGTY